MPGISPDLIPAFLTPSARARTTSGTQRSSQARPLTLRRRAASDAMPGGVYLTLLPYLVPRDVVRHAVTARERLRMTMCWVARADVRGYFTDVAQMLSLRFTFRPRGYASVSPTGRRLVRRRDTAMRLFRLEERMVGLREQFTLTRRAFRLHAVSDALFRLQQSGTAGDVSWAAKVLAAEGCLPQALTVLGAFSGESETDVVRRTTAEIRLRANDFAAAIDATRQLSDPGNWVNALTSARVALRFAQASSATHPEESRNLLVSALTRMLSVDDARLLSATAMLYHALGHEEAATRTVTRARHHASVDREGFLECLAFTGRREEALQGLCRLIESGELSIASLELSNSPFMCSLEGLGAWEAFRQFTAATPDEQRAIAGQVDGALTLMGIANGPQAVTIHTPSK